MLINRLLSFRKPQSCTASARGLSTAAPVVAMTLVLSLLGTSPLDARQPAAGDWPLPRGDAAATGVSPTQLADELVERWVTETGEAIESTPVIADSRVFVADVMGKLTAMRLSDGGVIWTKDYDTGFIASPAVMTTASGVPAPLLVIGDVEGNVYALDPATGEEKWTAETEGEIDGAAAFFDGAVLVTSQDGSLYRFDAADGSRTWVYETGDQIRCGATLADDRTFLG